MYMHHLLESLKGDVWQLSSNLDHLLGLILTLQDTTIMLHTNGAMSSQSMARIQALEIDNSISIPEAGVTLLKDAPHEIYLYEGTMSHRDICIEINFTEAAETLCISFDLTLENQAFINLITKLVAKVWPLHSHKSVRDKYAPNCHCCLEKQEELRKDTSSHPLSKILLNLEEATHLKLTHSGQFSHSVQEFQYCSQSTHWGIVYLHAGTRQYSIDLTQVYSLHARVDIFKGRPQTVLTGFNAHGHKILELAQEGMSALHQWENELKTATPSR